MKHIQPEIYRDINRSLICSWETSTFRMELDYNTDIKFHSLRQTSHSGQAQ